MNKLGKSLVEVECVLNRLDEENKKKIPPNVWDFISKNKDKNYVFKYDETKELAQQNLMLNTCSVLTCINMKYLLGEKEREEVKKILEENEQLEERKIYTPNDIFKNQN